METFTPAVKEQISVEQKMYCISGPLLACVYHQKKSQKKNPVILSSHTTAQEEVQGRRHGRNPQIKPKIATSYNKHMGGIDSSDIMLYTYLDETQTVCYLKKVAFSSIDRIVLNSHTLYTENYRGLAN
jgi:hypothetical protein